MSGLLCNLDVVSNYMFLRSLYNSWDTLPLLSENKQQIKSNSICLKILLLSGFAQKKHLTSEGILTDIDEPAGGALAELAGLVGQRDLHYPRDRPGHLHSLGRPSHIRLCQGNIKCQ
jgi:hypothetical protein